MSLLLERQLADLHVGLCLHSVETLLARLVGASTFIVWYQHVVRHAEDLCECFPAVVHAAGAFLPKQRLQHLRLLEPLSLLPAGQHAGTSVRFECLGVLYLLNTLQSSVAAGIQLGDHPRGQHEVQQAVFGHQKKKVIKFIRLLN